MKELFEMLGLLIMGYPFKIDLFNVRWYLRSGLLIIRDVWVNNYRVPIQVRLTQCGLVLKEWGRRIVGKF